ncbi:MAG: hypothetical protein J3R72DRAFT_24565 [Linnemannia gamsii]|nr:MAG: hypothetical protein J3R72DRAFT_24565 [Linnemannia gamsii]
MSLPFPFLRVSSFIFAWSCTSSTSSSPRSPFSFVIHHHRIKKAFLSTTKQKMIQSKRDECRLLLCLFRAFTP